ncbi:MAG: chain-length determining protein [Schwartzia sp.]|nr:chain-length determining protein [Schwartzia sp. (in: firmicutes)]
MEDEKEKDYTEIDLVEVYHILQENVRNIARVTICCVVLAILYLLIATPVYESQALLRVKQEKGLGSSLLESMGGSFNSMQSMSTYAEILKSRSVLVPVIEEIEEPNDEGKFPEYEGYKKGHITTEPLRDSAILVLKFTADEAEKAQHGTELLLESFQKHMAGLSHTEQSATRSFLETRTKEAKEELSKAEDAVTAYKATHKMVDPSEDAKTFVARLAEIEARATDNQITIEAAQAGLAAVNEQLQNNGPTIADNSVIQQYNAKLAELETARISLREKYTDKHPSMIDLEEQIDSMKEMLRQEIAKVAALEAPSGNPIQQELLAKRFQNEGTIAVARKKAAAYEALIAKNNQAMEAFPAMERGFIRVSRDAKVAGDIYVMLAKRLEEAKVAEYMEPKDIQVVDPPTLPEKPIKPRKLLTLALSVVLGLLLGGGYAVGDSMLNRTIDTEKDVEKYIGLPVLGLVPEEKSLVNAMAKQNVGEPAWKKVVKTIWKKSN